MKLSCFLSDQVECQSVGTCEEPGYNHLQWSHDGSPLCIRHSLSDPLCWECNGVLGPTDFYNNAFTSFFHLLKKKEGEY